MRCVKLLLVVLLGMGLLACRTPTDETSIKPILPTPTLAPTVPRPTEDATTVSSPTRDSATTDVVTATNSAESISTTLTTTNTPTLTITNETQTEFTTRLQQAIIAKDYAQLESMMGDPFIIGYWQSESITLPPATAIENLQFETLGTATAPAFQADPDLRGLLSGNDPYGMWGPNLSLVEGLHLTGLNANGATESIIMVAQRENGAFYWYSMLNAFAGFTPLPRTEVPLPPTTEPAVLGELPADSAEIPNWLAAAYANNIPWGKPHNVLLSARRQYGANDWLNIDLNGDGVNEWLITIYALDPPSAFAPTGNFVIISTEGVAYRYLDTIENFGQSAPKVVNQMDMTGDGLPDMIIQSNSCGAHTCYQYFDILSGHGNKLGRITPEVSAENPEDAINMSYSDVSFADRTGEGLLDLILYGGFIGSAGAGPYQRGRTEVWAWNGSEVFKAQTVLDPSNYRFHLLYEANSAFAAGDTEIAIKQYSQVVNDGSLEDAQGLVNPESTHDASRQFAAFRLMLAYAQIGGVASAGSWQTWLDTIYPNSEITRAAQKFIAIYNENPDLTEACRQVTEFLDSTTNPTGPLLDLGYALPSLSAETVCPITDVPQ